MTSIAFDAAIARREQSWVASFLKRIAYKEPKHVAAQQRKVVAAVPFAAESERRAPVSLNSALAYECDNWLRWTSK
ncbi:MAG: hypothetical protein JWM42_3536 [Burkholderia sp.]|nr:hypothetical protein [Burkholderia sp.]